MLGGRGGVRILVMVMTTALAALIPAQTSHAAPLQPLPPVTDADGRLGLCDVLPGSPPGSSRTWAQLAAAAGARVNRWEFRWDRIEARPGAWDFSADDPAVSSSALAGLDVLGILIGTPGWATAPGQRPGNGLPRGLYRPVDDPRNLWAVYVRQTVAHYGSLVRSWEVWNEPDLQFFWSSSPQAYFRLLKVSYLVIRATEPEAKVMLAGMVVPDLAFLSSVLQAAQNDPGSQANGGYFQAAAWHAYGPAAALYDNLQRIRSLLWDFGFGGRPIWVTEDGFPASNPQGEQRQAAYVIQTALYAFAAGAARVLVYRASDDPGPRRWGLLDAGGTPRAGYVAFQLTATYLAHARAVVYDPSPGVERFVIYRPGQRITVLWSRSLADQSVPLAVAQAPALTVDWMGQTTSPAVAGGQVTVIAPGAAYNAQADPSGSVVGGPPVFEIESNVPSAAAPFEAMVPFLGGSQRELVLFNQSLAPQTVTVAATAAPGELVVVQLPATTLQTVDLDALAGPSYPGPFSLSATGPVAEEAVTSSGSLTPSQASASWLVPLAPKSITLANPSGVSATVTLTTRSPSGNQIGRARLVVGPGLAHSWKPPVPRHAATASVQITASGPTSLPGSGQAAVQAAGTLWYALRLGGGRLAIYNPTGTPTSVRIRWSGMAAPTPQQLALAPGESVQVPSPAASAAVVTSGSPIAVSGGARGTRILAGSPDQSGVVVAGRITSVDLFNPTNQPQHVELNLVKTLGSTPLVVNLAPLQLKSATVRTPGGAPVGVLLSDGAPIVAAAR